MFVRSSSVMRQNFLERIIFKKWADDSFHDAEIKRNTIMTGFIASAVFYLLPKRDEPKTTTIGQCICISNI